LLNESNETKFSQWKLAYKQELSLDMERREAALKQKLKAERDEELKQVIQRLGEETSSSTSELLKSHRLEQERLKNQMAEELDKVN
jgi:hypothetical protein